MTRQVDMGDVVEAGAAEIAVGHVEAGRADDVDGDAKAGGKAQNRAGVLGDVGLVKGEAHATDLGFYRPKRRRV
jgi:hypothetical protein